MNRTKLLGAGLCAWFALEIIAFYFVVHSLGLFAAILLGFAATLLGLSDVKRLLVYWRNRDAAARADGAALDGALQALGSLLLILPGFASDFAGLALKSPSFRDTVAARIRSLRRTQAPDVIDLAPHEWKNVTGVAAKAGARKPGRRSTRSAPCP